MAESIFKWIRNENNAINGWLLSVSDETVEARKHWNDNSDVKRKKNLSTKNSISRLFFRNEDKIKTISNKQTGEICS